MTNKRMVKLAYDFTGAIVFDGDGTYSVMEASKPYLFAKLESRDTNGRQVLFHRQTTSKRDEFIRSLIEVEPKSEDWFIKY